MKKLNAIAIFLMLNMILLLVSCNDTNGTDNATGTDTDAVSDNITIDTANDAEKETDEVTFAANDLDREKTHRPTMEDVDKIELGMTYNEVCSVLGRPHDMIQTSGIFSPYSWETDDGTLIVVNFRQDEKGTYLVHYRVRLETEKDGASVVTLEAADLDAEKTHRPTAQDIKKIEPGMTFDEICAVLGRPHGKRDNTSCFYWDADNGTTIEISFAQNDDAIWYSNGYVVYYIS